MRWPPRNSGRTRQRPAAVRLLALASVVVGVLVCAQRSPASTTTAKRQGVLGQVGNNVLMEIGIQIGCSVALICRCAEEDGTIKQRLA